MQDVVFVTGNAEKAENFSKHMGMSIAHERVELEEIQTLDARELVEHKAVQAFEKLKRPVLVEDVTFTFAALGGLPGPFIKYFVAADDGLENMCRMLDGFESREAEARCTYGYYDGDTIQFFEGSLSGEITMAPRGENGFGFDRIFAPTIFNGKTAAELDQMQYDQYYSTIKPFQSLRTFIGGLDARV